MGRKPFDAIGARQASLFDLPEADPRATPEALAELRTGRILCLACQRTPELFHEPAPLPGETEADAAQIADFYAEQAEQDRDDDRLDAARIDSAVARLREHRRIRRIPRDVLDAHRAADVERARAFVDDYAKKEEEGA